jgi:hypothetical protein
VDELAGKTSYFLGNDPTQWKRDIPNYAKVRYEDIYPGIDLVYYGNQRQLEYDFVVAPGADPKMIKMHVTGAERIRVEEQGDLVMETALGEVRQHRPMIYQVINGARKQVVGGYALQGDQVSFEVGDYDAGVLLVIDPVLSYATLLTGTMNNTYTAPTPIDGGTAIAVDAQGNAYITGFTASYGFPVTPGALNQRADTPTDESKYFVSNLSQMAFVSKLNGNGTQLI